MIKIDSLVLGPYATNCYLLRKDDHVLIVDPGSKSNKIHQLIVLFNGVVDGIYLTHGHFDHIAGVDAMVDHYHCPVYMNELDMPLLTNPYLNVSAGSGLGDVVVKSKVNALAPGINNIGAFSFELVDAPGHSEGSSLMLWESNMICGDVIFKGSIGRTDLVGGSNIKMVQSLQMIRKLNPDYLVYPGHGEKTTLWEELKTNPYLI